MKRELAILSAFSTIVFLSGCSAKSGGGPGPALPAPQVSGWSVKLVSSCGDTAAESCRGAYGFSVLENGTYIVGPGPAGAHQKIVGKLTPEQQEKVTGLVEQLRSGLQVTSDELYTCAQHTAFDTSDELLLNERGAELGLVKASGEQFCYRYTAFEPAEALHNEIRQLAKTYYPVPFPDACLDAAKAVEALYPPLQACARSSDCVYVNNAYQPIPAGDMQKVPVDDCSILAPLVAANVEKLTEHEQGRLANARQNARAVCGARIVRLGCTSRTSFDTPAPAPVCDEGVCRRNPEVELLIN